MIKEHRLEDMEDKGGIKNKAMAFYEKVMLRFPELKDDIREKLGVQGISVAYRHAELDVKEAKHLKKLEQLAMSPYSEVRERAMLMKSNYLKEVEPYRMKERLKMSKYQESKQKSIGQTNYGMKRALMGDFSSETLVHSFLEVLFGMYHGGVALWKRRNLSKLLKEREGLLKQLKQDLKDLKNVEKQYFEGIVNEGKRYEQAEMKQKLRILAGRKVGNLKDEDEGNNQSEQVEIKQKLRALVGRKMEM